MAAQHAGPDTFRLAIMSILEHEQHDPSRSVTVAEFGQFVYALADAITAMNARLDGIDEAVAEAGRDVAGVRLAWVELVRQAGIDPDALE